jgi:hypothetical protein
MAFLIQPASVQKGVAESFTLDYAELALYAAIPAGYYKDVTNWKEVFVRVKHKHSKQKGTLHFTYPTTTASLLLSSTARAGDWAVELVLIRDYDKGEIALQQADMPDFNSYGFNVQSSASHGDLYVGNTDVLEIPSGGKRQYGDFVIEPGGVLNLANGGGITEIEVLGYCKVAGTVNANKGIHTGGTWSSTSVLGESLSHQVTQEVGGAGGQAEAGPTVRTPSSGYTGAVNSFTFVRNKNTNDYQVIWDSVVVNSGVGDPAFAAVGDTVYEKGPSKIYEDSIWVQYNIFKNQTVLGGIGGSPVSGNGAGGGRSAKFGVLNGGDATEGLAGDGAGQDSPAADQYGEDGPDSLTASEGGSGGFRGAHGQGFYLKAGKIEGTGTINASGQKGGDGGDGGEYLSEGSLYANGAGGGSAGGDGGDVWLRHQIGTPAVIINVAGGDRGNRGVASQDSTEAIHGLPGTPGTSDIAQF